MLVELNLDGTIGGSYFSLLYLVSGLNKKLYKPIVAFESPNTLVSRFNSVGIDTRVMTPRIPMRAQSSWVRPLVRAFNFLNAKMHSRKVVRRCLRLLHEENIGLLHLNNSVSSGLEWMKAAKKLGIPCITHERGLGKYFPRYSYQYGPQLAAVICISHAVRQNLITHRLGHLPIQVIYNGLDPDEMKITKAVDIIRGEYGIESTKYLIGMIGNIQQWKGQDVLIKAMSSLIKDFPELVCMLVGDISPHDPSDIAYHQDLKELIKLHKLEKHILMTGFRVDIANHVNAFEILVHASVTPEPFGRVLLEGMALHKPIVASRAGGVEEIVNDGESGLLFEPGDHMDLADKLRRLLNSDSQRLEIGEAGFLRLKSHFGIAKNVTMTESVYRSILTQK